MLAGFHFSALVFLFFFFRYNSLHSHKLTTNVNIYVFSMKILNKLADANVLTGGCNLLNDR